MNKEKKLFLVVIVLILSFFTVLYVTSNKHTTDYQVKSKTNSEKCLKGCTANNECPNGNLCFDCLHNPTCCCYDQQCVNCGTPKNV